MSAGVNNDAFYVWVHFGIYGREASSDVERDARDGGRRGDDAGSSAQVVFLAVHVSKGFPRVRKMVCSFRNINGHAFPYIVVLRVQLHREHDGCGLEYLERGDAYLRAVLKLYVDEA